MSSTGFRECHFCRGPSVFRFAVYLPMDERYGGRMLWTAGYCCKACANLIPNAQSNPQLYSIEAL